MTWLRLGLSAAVVGLFASTTMGKFLDPTDFTSLGAFPGGKVTIDTTALSVTGVVGKAAVRQQIGGPDVAVFTFDGGALLADLVTITGDRPAALLFQGSAQITGSIDARSAGARSGGAPSKNGDGPGAGRRYGGGGGFGGSGGNSGNRGVGGKGYGKLFSALDGGSGGGGADYAGGSGGGAVEIGALTRLNFDAVVRADGIDASASKKYKIGAGGGSGGGIFLHAYDITLGGSAQLLARGGDGGPGSYGGGGGGGGRIALLVNDAGTLTNDGATFNVGGGLGGNGRYAGISGTAGKWLLATDPNVGKASGAALVPEPAALLVWSLLAGLGVSLGRRRR